MEIIKHGGVYQLFDDDDISTFNELPVGTYQVHLTHQGYILTTTEDLKCKEEKVYGEESAKLKKVVDTYTKANRSLGVMLTGEKGTGKTLFVQLLSDKVMEMGLPVLLVSDALPGLADFLKSIQQEIMVVFDEFEKVFPSGNRHSRDDDDDDDSNGKVTQNDLLGLLDGTSSQKMLFIFTANYEDKINRLMIDRPGRIYYHFVFGNPDKNEVERYMKDKVPSKYKSEINKLLSYTMLHSFTFDELRAIANELANGYPLQESLQDLNIYAPSLEQGISLVTSITFSNGFQMHTLIKQTPQYDVDEKGTHHSEEVSGASSSYTPDIQFGLHGILKEILQKGEIKRVPVENMIWNYHLYELSSEQQEDLRNQHISQVNIPHEVAEKKFDIPRITKVSLMTEDRYDKKQSEKVSRYNDLLK